MFTILKEQFNRILQCLIYTVLMSLIYGIWTWSLWNLWYVTLLVVLVIVAVGVVVSYFWIKSGIKKPETNIENK